MKELLIYKALEKTIDSIEEAMITIYEAPFTDEAIARFEDIQEHLTDAWAEAKTYMRKLNPPF